MRELTELQMSIAFDNVLRSSYINGIPPFDLVYREVICQQGVADFVGLTNSNFELFNHLEELSHLESSSQILSLLKPKAGRTKSYLKSKTGLSDITLNRVLKDLCEKKYIIKSNNVYTLSDKFNFSKINIWAFELKLSNWKRASFQALQYKAFANYTVVVFPYEKETILREHRNSFRELNIGILLFDTATLKTKWILHPKKEQPISKWHTCFTLGKMANQFSQEQLANSNIKLKNI